MNEDQIIREALREDLGRGGDVTTRFFVPPGARLSGTIIAKAPGVVCGLGIARRVFELGAPKSRVRLLAKDGAAVRPGQGVMAISGGPKLLTAERTALNFLQHLSGVATLTSRYARKTRGTRAKIYDTRKTLPGWRELEKYAVRMGGGRNHRMGLYDAVLLKDNHWAMNTDLPAAAKRLRRRHPGMTLEMEAATLFQARRALSVGADIILLDNMNRPMLRKAIRLIRRQRPNALIEISGGVSLKTVRALARLGPDRISVGRLTHSAPILDLSLEIEPLSRLRK